jgi:hypothetical protein
MLQPHMFRPGLLGMAMALLATASGMAAAAEPVPEIKRQAGAAQAVGTTHTLRVIPEACMRLEGRFTGDRAKPYALAAVRTSARCQPRAALGDAGKARASVASGWLLNDVIRVPSAACASQQAVVRVWRKDISPTPPALDAQGRSRIYLKDGLDAARQGELKPIPVFATALSIEGRSCG